jgi:hypothetical protein
MKSILFIIQLFLFLFITAKVFSQSDQIPPFKDNTIYSEGDSSNGKGDYLFTGINNNGNERRALIQFDLSFLTDTDSLISASLQMYMSKTTSDYRNVMLYRVKKAWGEGTSNAIFEEGGGATAASGDATWNYAYYDTNQWINPGGDFDSIPSDSLQINQTGVYTWSGIGVLRDVNYWRENPDSNFGWIVIAKGQAPSSKRFNSGNNSENQPLLILQKFQAINSLHSTTNNTFQIFPNPSSGEFSITQNEDSPIQSIRVLSLTGAEIVHLRFPSDNPPSRISFHIPEKGNFILVINNILFAKLLVL